MILNYTYKRIMNATTKLIIDNKKTTKPGKQSDINVLKSFHVHITHIYNSC